METVPRQIMTLSDEIQGNLSSLLDFNLSCLPEPQLFYPFLPYLIRVLYTRPLLQLILASALYKTMASRTTVSLSALYLMFGSFCLGKTADMSAFNNPSHGPPAADFAAADSLPVSVLQAAAAAASIVPKDATYPFRLGSSEKSTIHSDWVSFKEVC